MAKTKQRQFWEQAYRAVVQLSRQRDWRLIPDVDLFAEKVLNSLESLGSDLDDVEVARNLAVREAVHQYSAVLYQASRADGTQRQHRAFEELWAYLLPIALHKTGDEELAQECTQQAIMKIWEKGNQCTDPGRFLGWCKVVLLNEIWTEFRKRKVQVIAISDLEETEEQRVWEQAAEVAREEFERPLENEVIEHQAFRRLVEELEKALGSQAQLAVIKGLVVDGLGVKAVAELLYTTPSNVHTLKSRALARLRQDDRFRKLLAEFLQGRPPCPRKEENNE